MVLYGYMIILDYIYWHYGVAPTGILGLLKNYLVGTWHKFLISIHFKTLLAPWHRTKPSELDTTLAFGDRVLNAIVDFYIRILAAIVRSIIILIGLAAELIIIAVFLIWLAIWLLWPAIFVFLISKGFSLVIGD